MTRVTSIVARKRKYVADEAPGESSAGNSASNSRAADPAKRAVTRRRIEDAKDTVLERTYRKKNDSQVRGKRPEGDCHVMSSRPFYCEFKRQDLVRQGSCDRTASNPPH
jgi:hypothetical protein